MDLADLRHSLELDATQGRHAIGTHHWTVVIHDPESAHSVGTAAGLINAPDLPLAGNDGVVRSVVDAGAETGRRKIAGHRSRSAQLLHHDPGALEFVQIKLDRRDRLG
jgi:hypothetical protein